MLKYTARISSRDGGRVAAIEMLRKTHKKCLKNLRWKPADWEGLGSYEYLLVDNITWASAYLPFQIGEVTLHLVS